MGMVLAKLGRKHVAVLVKGNAIEGPSDIDGLIYIRFNDRVNEASQRLAACLQEAGFTIQVKDLIS
jgi:predicted nucleotide-binding protein